MYHKSYNTTKCNVDLLIVIKVLLINAVKDVASALGELIAATKNASGKPAHDPTMSTLKDTAKVCFNKKLVPYEPDNRPVYEMCLDTDI